MLARMRQFLQPIESQKSRRPLDRMDGAEDLSQQSTIVRPHLQLGQAPFHPVQTLLALRNKLFR